MAEFFCKTHGVFGNTRGVFFESHALLRISSSPCEKGKCHVNKFDCSISHFPDWLSAENVLLSQEQKDNFYLYDFYLYLHEIRFYLNEIAAYLNEIATCLNEMYQLVSIRFDNWPLLPPLSATSRVIFRELPFNYGRNTDFLRR